MFKTFALTELVLCWIVWSMAFLFAARKTPRERDIARAPASWYGVALEIVGFALACAYLRPAHLHKPLASLFASMLLAPLSVGLAWLATRHLGKYWRLEAALSEDHQLVQSGPYRWIRHPIYASMLGMMLATGAAWTWWPVFLAALVVFLIGTELRVRAEDRLLAERFREKFTAYRTSARAYIPFVR